MTEQEIYQQQVNDKKQLEHLMIYLDLPLGKFNFSHHMKENIRSFVQQEINVLDYFINGPSEAELEFEQSLLNDVSEEQIDEEQMKSVLAS